MSDKPNKDSLEKAEELSEAELQKIEGGAKAGKGTLDVAEQGHKIKPQSHMEEAQKKQVASTAGTNPEGIKNGKR